MTVLPLAPFPNCLWFAALLSDSDAVLDQHENYQKQTWRNRYELVGANGRISLTIPIVGLDGVKTRFKEIKIANEDWQRIHWQTIKSAYGSSAYYIHYEDELHALFTKPFSWLVDFNLASIELQNHWLDLDRKIVLSDYYIEKEVKHDLRQNFKPTKTAPTFPTYPQVFSERHGFLSNLSGLDLIMNEGPMALAYFEELVIP